MDLDTSPDLCFDELDVAEALCADLLARRGPRAGTPRAGSEGEAAWLEGHLAGAGLPVVVVAVARAAVELRHLAGPVGAVARPGRGRALAPAA